MSIIDEVVVANEIYSHTHELGKLTPRPERKLAIVSTEHDSRTRIQNRTSTDVVAPAFFYAFRDIEENVRHQLQKLHAHPWIPKIPVRGFVYDVTTGLLWEIKDA
jgi:carbonic anhydrase